MNSTEQVQVLGFGIFTESGKRFGVAFVDRVVLFCPKGDVGLEASCPLVDVTFNLKKIKEKINKL